MNHCSRAQTMLLQAADGGLTAEAQTWLDAHTAACSTCRAYRARLLELDTTLAGYAEHLTVSDPPRADSCQRLLARIDAQARRASIRPRYIAAAVGAVAAAMMAGFWIHPTYWTARPPVETAAEKSNDGFVPIPYSLPLDPYENATVRRINISVVRLIAVGYRIPTADPQAVLKAEVLIGADGSARAFRLLENLTLQGVGD